MLMTVFRSDEKSGETSEILREVTGKDRERLPTDELLARISNGKSDFFREAEIIGTLTNEYGLTQDLIAARLSVSQSYVANKLRLLRYPARARERIRAARLSERHARALLRVRDDDAREELLDRVIENKLTVAKTEELVEGFLSKIGKDPARDNKNARDHGIRAFCQTVDGAVGTARRQGLDVTSSRHDEGGRVVFAITVEKKDPIDGSGAVDDPG